MLTRILAAGAFVALTAVTAQAGTLQNGTWTPSSCGAEPGPTPEMNGKTADSYKKSATAFQTWQDAAKHYIECATGEAKADQNAIVGATNKWVTSINQGSEQFINQANAAMEVLKKKAGQPH